MSILIVFICLLVAFVIGVVSAKLANVLNSGKAIGVGAVTGVVLAVIALVFIGAPAAIAALAGAIAGSIGYFFLQAAIIGGC